MACAHAGGPVRHLEDLRLALAGRGWTTSLQEPSHRPPSLFVQNPDPAAAALTEYVLATQASDGSCWFWWSWASPIAPADQIASAAGRITHLLRIAEEHPSGCDWPECHGAPDAGAGSKVAASTLNM